MSDYKGSMDCLCWTGRAVQEIVRHSSLHQFSWCEQMPCSPDIYFPQHALQHIVMNENALLAFCISVSLYPVTEAQRHFEAPTCLFISLACEFVTWG